MAMEEFMMLKIKKLGHYIDCLASDRDHNSNSK